MTPAARARENKERQNVSDFWQGFAVCEFSWLRLDVIATALS